MELHEINPVLASQIALLEHDAKDILTVAHTVKALMKQHQGGVIVGMSADSYANNLIELLSQIKGYTSAK